ncbi:acyltransferase [Bosea sp. LjRoot9]|uniref:acyltransferase family protein n=1 Tax=Bosea sp. LjRoot9 TaxID=3342341 RepID=UPI003ECEB806
MPSPQSETISNIQVLRGIAALSVVYYHTDFRVFGIHIDLGGVALFFVISGFIMTYISRASTDGFLVKRLIRIVPLYWFATIFALVWFNFGFANPTYVYPLWAKWLVSDPIQIVNWFAAQASTLQTPAHAWALVRSLLFLPSAEPPILGVGWTLNLEMFFYLLFSAALAISRQWAPAICVAFLGSLIIATQTAACGPICGAYGHGYIAFFILGIGCYYAWRWMEPIAIRNAASTAILCWLVFAVWLAGQFVPSSRATIVIGGHVVPTAVVLAALLLHSIGRRAANRPMLALGAASYSIYLMHTIVLDTFRAAGTSISWLATNDLVGMILSITASVVVSFGVYSWFEVPILRLLRRLSPGRPIIPQGVPAE